MKKIILSLCFVLLLVQAGRAQDYNSGIGIRGGVFSGVSFKQFLSDSDALEFVGAFHHRGLLLTVLYQRHVGAFDVPGLRWYYGGGGFVGFYDGVYHPSWDVEGGQTVLGASGVVGMEYKIEDIPISIGVDLIPSIDLIPVTRFWIGAGLTIRYVF
ncbi:MAG TPA: hypothetical protein VLH37_00195 [Bacteroidales bacterium]|nr:hypothetical protein [Bacteroidales bacterium]